ncbi:MULTISPECIES: lytic transglycosylase F [unclassified Ensifer]|uniref:transglycosylase SLT domain-containing protein n=1 Tax=unclassified Ensifer TaxID=2633371 RepID=UPI000813CD70|nr:MULTISPECIES: lytic transglycosylase F [unclassified Ensifer]OCP15330.1 lytic transglycosylase F [Ensifer sp. LC384]OCP16289.1 lytic transglycosylase F [Ensifer sp. LC163]OCP21552.1 lytic transglycosylase F [Ensifer sp. LC54]
MKRLALFMLLFAIVGIGNLQAQSNESTFQAIIAPHLGDLDVMEKRRLIRIVVPFSKTIYFIDRGRQLGTAVEFGMALEKELNAGRKREIEKIRIAFVPVPRARLLTALEDGRGDIVMGNLTITEARLAKVDFTAPLFDEAKEVLVTGPSAPAIASVDDLSGQEVRVRKSSSYHEHLVALSAGFVKAGRAPISIKDMDENLEDEDVLEMINAGLLPWTVVDKYKADIWATVFRDIKVRDDILVSDHGQIAWAIRKDSPKLKATLDAFVKTHRVGTTFGNILKNSYYKSDKMLKRAYAPADVERFQKLVEIFRKHGDTYSFDYLMLMAQGYQESQLDQSRRSPRGAVGVMQLLPSTAADKSVGIKGIDKDQDLNVQAGSKYLRHLVDTYIADPAITPRNQLLFAFAAYNAGPGNLRKFRAKAKDMGLNPDLWFGNVENAAAEIVGRETVQYVGNIYKYYVAYGLLAEHAKAAPTAQAPAATDAGVE